MRLAPVLLAAFALAACKKAPPPGRPADLCADIKAVADCSALPEGKAATDSTPAANCYWVGTQQLHCGLFAESSFSLERSAAFTPSARTFHSLGDAYYVQELWQQARGAYRKAVDLDPKKRESWVRLSQLAFRAHDLAAALEYADRTVALDAKRADGHCARADALGGLGRYAEGVKELELAAALSEGKNRTTCFEQEVELLQLQLRKLRRSKGADEAIGDASEALGDALERVISSGPAPAQQYRELADARLGAGDRPRAEAALQKAAELDAKDFVSPRLVGMLREQRGDVPGARAALARSLQVQDRQAMAHIVLGRLDAASGDLPSAQREFDVALGNEDAKDAHETRELAELAFKVGRGDKAEQLYRMLDDDPELSAQVGFWLDRARISSALHHKDEVASACRKAKALVETATCPPVLPPR
jgi:tetratricopeptide (TPR) repeat protein